MSIDEDYLLKALDNDNNQSIMYLTKSEIKTIKNNILQKLQLERDDLKELHRKLKDYRYIENVNDINYGSFVRWVNIKDIENMSLKKGAFVCNVKVTDNNILVICKIAQYFKTFKFDECLIFQRLSNQEQVLLDVLEHLKK